MKTVLLALINHEVNTILRRLYGDIYGIGGVNLIGREWLAGGRADPFENMRYMIVEEIADMVQEATK